MSSEPETRAIVKFPLAWWCGRRRGQFVDLLCALVFHADGVPDEKPEQHAESEKARTYNEEFVHGASLRRPRI